MIISIRFVVFLKVPVIISIRFVVFLKVPVIINIRFDEQNDHQSDIYIFAYIDGGRAEGLDGFLFINTE